MTPFHRGMAFLGRPAAVGPWRPSWAMLIVLGLSAAVNALEVLGASVLYQPDSGNYVLWGYEMAYRFTLASVNLNRVPGYPVLEAPFFRLFGDNAMYALKVFQHGQMVALSGVIVALGDCLDRKGRLGFVAGVFSCFALQLHSYAHQPMSELPYALMAALGLLYAFRYAQGGTSAALMVSVSLFGVATLIRPAGVLLGPMVVGLAGLRAVFPRWNYLWPEGGPRARGLAVRQMLGAGAVVMVLWVPWPAYNAMRFHHFGMTATFGQNFWSNVVEYGEIWDENSPAVQDIHRRWDEYQVMQTAKGIVADPHYTWRSHHPTTTAYMAASGADFLQTNKVMQQGAMDSLRRYPGRFFRHIAHNLWITLAIPEPTYLYAQTFSDDDIRPRWMVSSFSLTEIEPIRAYINSLAEGAGFGRDRVTFDRATVFTPLYVRLALWYHQLASNEILNIALVVVGGAIACFHAARRRGLPWLALVLMLLYLVVVPMVVVPGAPRHRLPADPELQLIYAAVVVSALYVLDLVWRYRRRLLERIEDDIAGFAALSPRERGEALTYLTAHVVLALLLAWGLWRM